MLLRWGLRKGHITITTSSSQERQAQFLQVAVALPLSSSNVDGSSDLTDADVAAIDEAGRQLKFRKYWGPQFEASGL